MTLRPAPNHSGVDPRATAADPSASRSTSTAETHADRPAWAADRTESRSSSTAEMPNVDRRGPAADPYDSEPGHGSRPSDPPDIKVISDEISPSHEVSPGARAGTRAGQGRAGQGGSGVGQGRSGSGKAGQGRRRRRRGGRSKNPPVAGAAADQSKQGRAGSPPRIDPPPGQFGSPWHNASGRNTTDELDCPTHGLPAPCRLCVQGES